MAELAGVGFSCSTTGPLQVDVANFCWRHLVQLRGARAGRFGERRGAAARCPGRAPRMKARRVLRCGKPARRDAALLAGLLEQQGSVPGGVFAPKAWVGSLVVRAQPSRPTTARGTARAPYYGSPSINPHRPPAARSAQCVLGLPAMVLSSRIKLELSLLSFSISLVVSLSPSLV